MKKTLLLMPLATMATALADPSLVYGLDFEEHGSGVNIAVTPGMSQMGQTGYINYAPNESVTSPLAMDGVGSYHVTTTHTFTIDGGTDGIKDASGNILNTKDGFAITLNALNQSSISTGWRDVLNFKLLSESDSTEKLVQVEWNAASENTSVSLYGLPTGGLTLNGLVRDKWYNLTISIEDNVCSFTAHDSLGELVASASTTFKEEWILTYVKGGGSLADRNNSHIMDNFAIYDAALNEEQRSGIVKYEMAYGTLAQVAPEPATATLSLLALAALAARRKRH